MSPFSILGQHRRGALGLRLALAVTSTAVSLLAGQLLLGPADAVTVQSANPAQNTCNQPDDPCYTARQMMTYFHQRTHHFLYLAPKFDFPAAFIHQAQAARAAYCKTHPVICRNTMRMLYDYNHPHGKQRLPDGADSSCGRYAWWCNERGWISCAGGAVEPYWSCPGAYAQQTAQEMEQNLSTTDKVLIYGGVMIVGEISIAGSGPTTVIIGRAAYGMFATWIGLS